MNYELRCRIEECLRRHDAEMMASEIAVDLRADVDAVRTELRILCSESKVTRLHSSQGVLRYVTKRRHARAVDAEFEAQVDVETRRFDPRDPGCIEGLSAQINRVGGDTDIFRRLQSLELLGSSLMSQLSHALADVESARANLQAEVGA